MGMDVGKVTIEYLPRPGLLAYEFVKELAKTVKRKAPSRARYEQKHPTVSCRVPMEVYHRLQTAKKADGRSFADILKVGLGILEAQAKEEAEVVKKAHTQGYAKDYAEAERLYKVTYPCNVCGKILTVTSADEKQAIKEYMPRFSWGHTTCHQRR